MTVVRVAQATVVRVAQATVIRVAQAMETLEAAVKAKATKVAKAAKAERAAKEKNRPVAGAFAPIPIPPPIGFVSPN